MTSSVRWHHRSDNRTDWDFRISLTLVKRLSSWMTTTCQTSHKVFMCILKVFFLVIRTFNHWLAETGFVLHCGPMMKKTIGWNIFKEEWTFYSVTFPSLWKIVNFHDCLAFISMTHWNTEVFVTSPAPNPRHTHIHNTAKMHKVIWNVPHNLVFDKIAWISKHSLACLELKYIIVCINFACCFCSFAKKKKAFLSFLLVISICI